MTLGGASAKRTGAGLALFGAGLLALVAGRFVGIGEKAQNDSDQEVLPLAVLAAVLAIASVVVALRERGARRALGVASAALLVVLVVLGLWGGGFRFVWAGGEGELFYFELVLGLAALFLLTPRFWASGDAGGHGAGAARRLTAWARVSLHALALVVLVLTAFTAGAEHFSDTHCSGPDFDGECDVAALEGLLWVAVATVLFAVVVTVVEVRLARRRPQEHQLS
ncbi:hypothetical protein [Nocardioides pacificus]